MRHADTHSDSAPGPQVLVDMSCGSGLFARRFAKSGRFAGVIAADFSENMLKETDQYFRQDVSIDPACADASCVAPLKCRPSKLTLSHV